MTPVDYAHHHASFELHPPPRLPDEEPPCIGPWLFAMMEDEFGPMDGNLKICPAPTPYLQGWLKGLLKVLGGGSEHKDKRGDIRRLAAFIEQHNGVTIVVVP